jgi:methylamine--corrinoid protein Co-methyltransferase
MDFVEVCHRLNSGPTVSEKDFDLQVVFPKMREMTQKYGIKYDPQNPVTSDDALADRIFEADVDFFSQVGVYCKDTHKIAKFTREEILGSVKGNHPCLAGEGKDAKEWKPRRPDQTDIRVWCQIGAGILFTTEELFLKVVEGYSAIPRADSMLIPMINKYKGSDIFPGHPLEVMAAIQNVRLARQAMNNVGRPGFPIFNVVPASGTAQATIAASCPTFGARPSDGWLVATFPEFKVSYEMLSKTAYLKEMKANICGECSALLGGYAGGPEGVAIAQTVYAFFSTLIYGATYHLNFPVTMNESITTSRDILWAMSLSSQAVSRNMRLPCFVGGYAANGPATENYFYEAAAYILSAVVSGVTATTPLPVKGVLPDGMTPLECLFHTEVTDAAVKMTRRRANEIVKKLLERYEPSLAHPDRGLTYPQCFDLRQNKPNDAYAKLYEKVKRELASLGLKLD